MALPFIVEQLGKDKYSDPLTQDKSIFSIGTGKNAQGQDVDISSSVVNSQISDIVIKGNSLKNELNYNRDTWAEWNKTAGVTGDSTGLNLVADGVNWKYGSVVSNFKPNTKYGILYSVISSTLTGSFVTGIEAFPSTLLPKAIGNNKAIATSKTDISSNAFKVQVYNNEPSGNAIKIRDIRIFELPAGSQIETDFETLTADELAQKYPYTKGDGTKSTFPAGGRIRSNSANLLPPFRDWVLPPVNNIISDYEVKLANNNRAYIDIPCQLGLTYSFSFESGSYEISERKSDKSLSVYRSTAATTFTVSDANSKYIRVWTMGSAEEKTYKKPQLQIGNITSFVPKAYSEIYIPQVGGSVGIVKDEIRDIS